MRKALLMTCLALGGVFVDPVAPFSLKSAEASVAIAHTLEELVEAAPTVVLAKAVERKSQWEEVGGSRRIVTYTKLEVATRLYGPAEGTLWVRTLGGAVGKVGQQVAGEASFRLGERAIVFLTASNSGVTVVAGAAQGHFPLREPSDAKAAPTLRPSPLLGTLLDRPGPRITVFQRLVDKPLSEAISIVRATKAARDAKK